jgi:hypothetical protein
MHDSKTSGNSFMANLVKGVGGVWACQSQSCIAARDGKKGGDTLEFVATMEGCSLREAAEKMHTWFGASAGKRKHHLLEVINARRKPSWLQKKAVNRAPGRISRSTSLYAISIPRIRTWRAGE